MQNQSSTSDLFRKFSTIQWQQVSDFKWPNHIHQKAVCDLGSMTAYLKQFCQKIHVEAKPNQWLSKEHLSDLELKLLMPEDEDKNKEEASFLLRQVVLYGNDSPWLLGSTLIPRYPSNQGQTENLQSVAKINFEEQGNTPIGNTAFSQPGTYRNHLEVASITDDSDVLIARRSLIWVQETPLLVAEIFLTDSPIYQKEI